MVQSLGKTVWRSLKKLKLELLYDPPISLLGMCPKELKTGFGEIAAFSCSLKHYAQYSKYELLNIF
jgi:hypothetical protein